LIVCCVGCNKEEKGPKDGMGGGGGPKDAGIPRRGDRAERPNREAPDPLVSNPGLAGLLGSGPSLGGLGGGLGAGLPPGFNDPSFNPHGQLGNPNIPGDPTGTGTGPGPNSGAPGIALPAVAGDSTHGGVGGAGTGRPESSR